jgi:hypothetical protein
MASSSMFARKSSIKLEGSEIIHASSSGQAIMKFCKEFNRGDGAKILIKATTTKSSNSLSPIYSTSKVQTYLTYNPLHQRV